MTDQQEQADERDDEQQARSALIFEGGDALARRDGQNAGGGW